MLTPIELTEDVYLDCGWMYIHYKNYLKPNSYLQDAINDLESGNERRNLNNAIRNAKAALHMKVDILCISFAGEKYFKNKLRSFPKKMDFLESIGITRPRIIEKINKIRNEIEHEYRDATLEEAEDFIDIVLLFIEATKYFNSRFPVDGDFHGPAISELGFLRRVICNWKDGELVFFYTVESQYSFLKMTSHSIKVGDERYSQWVKFIIEQCD